MGVVASNFQGSDGGILAEVVEPSSDDWILKHAEACNLSVSEVEGRWRTFQKLGCNKDGFLNTTTIGNLKTQNSGSDGLFIDKVLSQFPKTENGDLSFQTYCNAAKWFSDANIETRVKGTFQVLNNGNPLDERILRDILREIYDDASEAVIKRTAQVFIREVDAKGQGSIDEADFVSWVQRMPSPVVEQIMKFDSQTAPSPGPEIAADDSNPDLPLSVLRRVAHNAKNRDWLLLANKLGFTEEDIRDVGEGLGDRKHDEHLFELLKLWRSKTDVEVTMDTLKAALVSSGLGDVAAVLET